MKTFIYIIKLWKFLFSPLWKGYQISQVRIYTYLQEPCWAMMNIENHHPAGCDEISSLSPRGQNDIKQRTVQTFTFNSEDVHVSMVQSYTGISSRSWEVIVSEKPTSLLALLHSVFIALTSEEKKKKKKVEIQAEL